MIAKTTRPVPAEPIKSRVFLPPEDPIFGAGYRFNELRSLDETLSILPDLIETADISCAVIKRFQNFSSSFYKIKRFLTDNERVALRRDLAFLEAAIYSTADYDSKEDEQALAIVRPILQELSKEEGTSPELTYHLYVFNNFRRINPEQPRKLGNLRAIRRFTNSIDEHWFILNHLACSLLAEQILNEAMECITLLEEGKNDALTFHLLTINLFLLKIQEDLNRLNEACHPAEFRRCVFRHLKHFNPEENPLFQFLDAFYGVKHQNEEVKTLLKIARQNMTRAQVRCIELLESLDNPIRKFVSRHAIDNQPTNAFNRGIGLFINIRGASWNFANKITGNVVKGDRLVEDLLASFIFSFDLGF